MDNKKPTHIPSTTNIKRTIKKRKGTRNART